MKRINLFIILSAFFMLCTGDIAAQSLLKKISKSIDDAGKQIEEESQRLGEIFNTDEQTSTTVNNVSTSDIQNYNGVKVKSFHSQVEISIVSCIRENDITTINYIMRNKGSQISLTSLGTHRTIMNPDDETGIYDDLGNSYKIVYQSLGKEDTQHEGQLISALLVPNVPTKGVIRIKSVDPRAKSFSFVNMVMLIHDVNQQLKPYSFSFTDLPIYNIDDIVNASTIKRVNNPYIEKQTNANTKIKSVIITKDATRIEMSWTNTKHSPYGTIWINNVEALYLELNGRKYRLLESAGMGKRQGDVKVDKGQSVDFSITLEKIPDNTETFDLYVDGWDFFGVKIDKR